MTYRAGVYAVLGLALISTACDEDASSVDDEDASSVGKECDPLTGDARPIMLGDFVGAGRDEDGIVYVLSEDERGELRAFVSDGEVLERRRVLGSGSGSGDGTRFYDASVEGVEGEQAFSLRVETDEAGEVLVTKSDQGGRILGDAGVTRDELELVERDELSRFTLQNLAPEVYVEYFGSLVDGRRIVVVRPENDWAYEDFRTFLGPSERVLEREVANVSRQLDGGSTRIVLEIEGERAELSFPIESDDGQFRPGISLFVQGDEIKRIELLEPDPDVLAELTFVCR